MSKTFYYLQTAAAIPPIEAPPATPEIGWLPEPCQPLPRKRSTPQLPVVWVPLSTEQLEPLPLGWLPEPCQPAIRRRRAPVDSPTWFPPEPASPAVTTLDWLPVPQLPPSRKARFQFPDAWCPPSARVTAVPVGACVFAADWSLAQGYATDWHMTQASAADMHLCPE